MDDSVVNGMRADRPAEDEPLTPTPNGDGVPEAEQETQQIEGSAQEEIAASASQPAGDEDSPQPSFPYQNGHGAADQEPESELPEVSGNGHGAAEKSEPEQPEASAAVEPDPISVVDSDPAESDPVVAEAPAAAVKAPAKKRKAKSSPGEAREESPNAVAPGLPSIDEMLAQFAARPPEPEPVAAAAVGEADQIVAEGADGADGADGTADGVETPAVVDEWIPGDWFVVHTYSGYENKVKTSLEMRVHSMNMEQKIFEIVVPMEDAMEIKQGKKQLVQRKVFPGYLLVRMDLDDDSWYVVRNTPGVTGFVGSGTKPIPLSVKEVDQILQRKDVEVKVKPKLEYSAGDGVRVIAGPFANFQGVISEIDTDRSKLKVLVNIFGRETPVELGFDQVSKL